jgi:hypothetical protein
MSDDVEEESVGNVARWGLLWFELRARVKTFRGETVTFVPFRCSHVAWGGGGGGGMRSTLAGWNGTVFSIP